MDDRQSRRANQGSELSLEQFVAETELTAAAGIVTDIKASARPFITEDRNTIQVVKGVAGELGSENIGSDEKRRLSERLVELAGAQVTGPEKQVATPLAAPVSNVHEGHARAGGEI